MINVSHLKVNVIMLWEGLDLNNNVCKYEVNRLTNEKLIRGNKTLKQIVNDAGRRPVHLDGISPIYNLKFSFKSLANKRYQKAKELLNT